MPIQPTWKATSLPFDKTHSLSNPDGEVGIILGNGMLRRRQIDLLFLDFLDWLFTFGVSRNDTEINCAIARYKINKGIINTEVFYLDSPKIAARGEGIVDLGTEKLMQ